MTCALQFLGCLMAIILTVSYRLENKRRDRVYGKPDPNATVDTAEMADKVRARAAENGPVSLMLTLAIVGAQLPVPSVKCGPLGPGFDDEITTGIRHYCDTTKCAHVLPHTGCITLYYRFRDDLFPIRRLTRE